MKLLTLKQQYCKKAVTQPEKSFGPKETMLAGWWCDMFSLVLLCAFIH